VVIIQGAADVSAPPENGRLLRAEIGDRAVSIELPGVGHAVGVEDPEGVARVVIAQLALATTVSRDGRS
jgi:pimeloyl-ACP methyl ester carboxylesterase